MEKIEGDFSKFWRFDVLPQSIVFLGGGGGYWF